MPRLLHKSNVKLYEGQLNCAILQFLLYTNVALVQNFMSVLGVMESKEIPTQVASIGPEGNHNANSKIFAFISRP